jgi:pimeloyl-ACP methyl ester carboxylesterase
VAAVSKSCLDAAERDKLFRFTTSDGATLVGVALGRGSSGLVLGHQLGSDLCEWLPQARMLAKRAYRVLAFDFAGFGDSPHGPADSRVDTDVVAAAADDHPFLEHARELRDAARVRDKRLLVIRAAVTVPACSSSARTPPGSGPPSKASSPSRPVTEWRMRCGSG